MQLTRQELEDIWENKPYGYFSKMLKERKGTKKYIVTTEARMSSTVDQEVVEVWAKDYSDATRKATAKSVDVLRKRLGLGPWGNPSVNFVTTAKGA